ncbi:MAG: DUF3106 domain-containing protein [Aquitalea sp.]|nr:DUF3106 domain-containing protein [Aquitalea sp.]
MTRTLLLPALLLSSLLSTPLLASPLTNPRWEQLDGEQQAVMAPLASEWDRYAPEKKQNLLAIVPAYRQLDAAGQQRLQGRLKSWADLTLEQRQQIRHNWKKLQGLPPADREKAIQRLQHSQAGSQTPG